MKLVDVAKIRFISHHIAGTGLEAPKDLVSWMGAMQAQDYAMVKWAVGVRLPNVTDQAVDAAINNAEVIRTHVLRPTWHLVSAQDIYWLLALTAPHIKASLRSRHRELGLSETIFRQSNAIMEKALRDGKHLTRNDLLVEIKKAQISIDENRASHLFLWAELDGIVCSGAIQAGKQTYALLEERVPKPNSTFSKDDLLAKLARRYYTSHGPATWQDFAWWSGLSVGDAKHALDMAKADLVSETIDSQVYWFDPSVSMPVADI